jgi:ankyrin repeat protein
VQNIAASIAEHDTVKMRREIDRDKKLIDYKEPKSGMTLLGWTVQSEYYNESRILIQNGADPYVPNSSGKTPLMEAAFIDMGKTAAARKSSEFISLCLSSIRNKELNDSVRVVELSKALLISASSDLKASQVLVEAGADINYFNSDSSETPLANALTSDKYEIARYLLIEKGAKHDYSVKGKLGSKINYYSIKELASGFEHPSDPEKAKIKDEIIKYLAVHDK